MLIQNIRRIIK